MTEYARGGYVEGDGEIKAALHKGEYVFSRPTLLTWATNDTDRPEPVMPPLRAEDVD